MFLYSLLRIQYNIIIFHMKILSVSKLRNSGEGWKQLLRSHRVTQLSYFSPRVQGLLVRGPEQKRFRIFLWRVVPKRVTRVSKESSFFFLTPMTIMTWFYSPIIIKLVRIFYHPLKQILCNLSRVQKVSLSFILPGICFLWLPSFALCSPVISN